MSGSGCRVEAKMERIERPRVRTVGKTNCGIACSVGLAAPPVIGYLLFCGMSSGLMEWIVHGLSPWNWMAVSPLTRTKCFIRPATSVGPGEHDPSRLLDDLLPVPMWYVPEMTVTPSGLGVHVRRQLVTIGIFDPQHVRARLGGSPSSTAIFAPPGATRAVSRAPCAHPGGKRRHPSSPCYRVAQRCIGPDRCDRDGNGRALKRGFSGPKGTLLSKTQLPRSFRRIARDVP